MKKTNHAFSLVELVAAVAIIVILTVAAYTGIRRVQDMLKNSRMTNDLIAVESALNQYYRDHDERFPLPEFSSPLDMNMLCFTADAAFSECETAAFYQGRIDEKLLTKRYLPEIPRDPWASTNYAYGVSADGKYFMVAGIQQEKGDVFSAYAVSNLFKGYHLPSLIRAYDRQDFVTHKGTYLPYSPDPARLSAQLINATGVVEVITGDGLVKNPSETLYPGDTIKTGSEETADIFFSDGSVTHLGENSTLIISSSSSAEKKSDGNVITRVRLKLLNGTIWNKVVRLAAQSEFNVETTSAIAGVRGTEFGVCVNDSVLCPSEETVIVEAGTVEVSKIDEDGNAVGTLVELDAAAGAVMLDVGVSVLSPGNVLFVPASSLQQSFVDANETPPLHSGISPYIIAFDIPKQVAGSDNLFIAFVGMNGFTSRDYKISGFEIFPKSLFSDSVVRRINDGVLDEAGRPTDPAVLTLGPDRFVDVPENLSVNNFTYDEDESVYKIALPMPTLNAQNRYDQDGVILRAYSDSAGKHPNRAYSNFSWPSVGFNVLSGDLAAGIFADFRQSSMYDSIAAASEPLELVSALVLADVCADGGGSLDGSSCWIMGAAGVSCTAACETFAEVEGVTASCDTTDWNADATICTALGAVATTTLTNTDINNEYSPFIQGTLCRLRNATPDDSVPAFSCGALKASRARICKCQ